MVDEAAERYIIDKSNMRRKLRRAYGIPPFVLPAYPWLVELLKGQGIPKREWVGERIILRWGSETEVSFFWPVAPREAGSE